MNSAPDARTMADLAGEALAVQDACNLSGVVHGFGRSIRRLRELLREQGQESTDRINRHPISMLWADKIASLAGTQWIAMADMSAAFDSVKRLRD